MAQDTMWNGAEADKLYLQSGHLTTTLKTSEDVSAIDTSPDGVSTDQNGDTNWSGNTASKFYLTSGRYTSTIKTSEDNGHMGIVQSPGAWGGADMVHTNSQFDKHWLVSGQFTTTIKTSWSFSAISISSSGITWDGTNTPWGVPPKQKLFLNSGQFTSTVKASWSHGSIDGLERGLSFNGTDTPWTSGNTRKIYIQSGQFTSTIKDSVALIAIDNQLRGVEGTDFGARAPLPPIEPSEQTLTLTAHAPTILTNTIVLLPALSLSLNPEPVAVIGTANIPVSPIGLALTAHDPVVSISVTVTPAPLAITVAAVEPSLFVDAIVIIPAPLPLSVAAIEPEIDLETIVLISGAIAITATAEDPTINVDMSTFLSGLSLSLSLPAPTINITGGKKTLVANSRNFAISEYSSFAFNSMGRLNGKFLYANAGGIYEGGGDDDDGTKIDASYKTGAIDIFTTEKQLLRDSYLNFRSDGDIQLFSVGEELNLRAYTITNSANATLHERRVKFERGIKDRHFSFGVSNINGSTLEVDTARILTEPVRKRR
jgi:hypothetical protein